MLHKGRVGRIAVTGGSGFIGAAFARRACGRGVDVVNLDAGTYAADERRLAGAGPGRLETIKVDVSEDDVEAILRERRCDAVVHFAAESHVTRSEIAAEVFYRSNVVGTQRVMEAAERVGVPLVVHISTDEVYGPCFGAPFREDEKLPGEGNATSAYARSKALADDVARAFADRLPVIVVRPTNCFGPWQHPEKAIPRWTTRALRGEPIPVWGDGGHVRDWMYVDDAVTGIETVIERGAPGEVYNLGPGFPQRSNVEVARLIARIAGADESLVYLTAYDRSNHDPRYALDSAKITALGWRPRSGLEESLARTVAWYRDHSEWWKEFVAEAEALYPDREARA